MAKPVRNDHVNTYGIWAWVVGFAFATFIYLNTKKNYRLYMSFLFIWATIISYSRIYLGVHFPTDIIFGAVYGLLSGYLFYKLYFFGLAKLKG